MPTYNEIVSPVAEFFGYTPEAALEGRKGPRKTQATWQDRVLGIDSSELKAEEKVQKEYDLNETFKAEWESLHPGKTYNPKIGEGATRRDISDARTLKNTTEKITAHNLLDKVAGGGADQRRLEGERHSERMTIEGQRHDQTMQRLLNSDARSERNSLLDRAERADERATDREYQQMRDRKEDRRYNENIARMDRKDRQASIQTLVSGLANLGAAFAL